VTGAPSPWRPLVEGETASRALEAVEGIARALAAPEILAAPGLGLNGGRAGLALFFSYVEEIQGDPAAGERAELLLDQAIDELGRTPNPPANLYGGFAGLAWVVEHLTGGGGDEAEAAETGSDGGEDPSSSIDVALRTVLGHTPWRDEFDLLGGLVGYGVYALERGARASAAPLLPAIVARLAERARPAEEGRGLVWSRTDLPERRPDPGMAHGAAGVVALLARIAREGGDERLRAEATALLEDAVEGVLPAARAGDGSEGEVAWCAGNLGLSAALLAAGRAVGRLDWEAAALDLARAAAGRRVGPDETLDPGLCHGTAGLGHLFHRLHQATGEETFREAALSWLERTLARRSPGSGVGGYRKRGKLPEGGFGWVSDPGFLGGSAGIGLALLAAAAPVEPAWDRLLLLSGR
jgi:hypothetical protein